MRARRLRRPWAVGVIVVALGASLMTVSGASAEPRPTIEQVQAQLDALEARAEAASEAFNGAQQTLATVTAKTAAAQVKVKAAQEVVSTVGAAAGHLAAHAYMDGGYGSSIGLLLAEDPGSFLDKALGMQQMSRMQNDVLRRARVAQLNLAQAQAVLQQQKAEAAVAVKEMAAHRAEINAAVADTTKLLSGLQEQERQRLAAIAAAQKVAAARAADVARRAQAARAAAAERANRSKKNGGGTNDSGGTGNDGSGGAGDTSGSDVGSGRAATAVRYALAQVGEPYSYSANPPTSWDCSKLTTWAWRQAGVSLTPYSYAQAQEVRRISRSELRPGDLLFYFNNAHHVAMYIGGGQIVEASSPRTGVQVTSAWNSWSSAHFSFAGRPVG